MQFGYDELYGVELEEYNSVVETEVANRDPSITFTEAKTSADIKLLEMNYHKLLSKRSDDSVIELLYEIRNLIEKKRKHLARLKKWKSNNYVK